jgi:hypothetical protein
LRKLEFYTNKKLGIDISYVQIRKILTKHSLRFKKTRIRSLSNDPEYEAKWPGFANY